MSEAAAPSNAICEELDPGMASMKLEIEKIIENGQNSSTKKRRRSLSKRAGLIFPVSTVRSKYKSRDTTKRIRKGAAVYLTAVLEYLVAEVLELSGETARDDRKVRIKPHHIKVAVENDAELKTTMGDIIIKDGGVRSEKEKRGHMASFLKDVVSTASP